MRAGIAYAVAGFVLWGLMPLYFRQISAVPALEVVLHRSVWALLFLVGVLAVLRRFAWLRDLRRQPRLIGLLFLNAWLLAGNWLLYVYAVQRDRKSVV